MKRERVAILGASDNPERYAHKAMVLLTEHGHTVLLVNPRLSSIDGIPCTHSLLELEGPIDTLTIYLRPELSSPLIHAILSVRPKRVIMNPGSENAELKTQLEVEGISVQEACTLVLLRTGQF